MAIYGRWGGEVEVLRVGTLEDVKNLDKRKPDAEDRDNVKYERYLVCRDVEDGRVLLQGIPFIRADDGIREIMAAVRTAQAKAAEEVAESKARAGRIRRRIASVN